MKRILLLCAMVGLLASQTSADMYKMNAPIAAGMRLLSVSTDDFGTLDYVGYKPGDSLGDYVWGSKTKYGDTMAFRMGFRGQLDDVTGDDSVIATIGLSAPTLSGRYEGFLLPISNDDNQIWRYQAYVTVGNTTYTSAWAQLDPDDTAGLLADIGASTDFSTVTGIGFNVEWKPSVGGGSSSDDFHASVVPVPAGVLLGFLGLGAAGLGLRKFS